MSFVSVTAAANAVTGPRSIVSTDFPVGNDPRDESAVADISDDARDHIR